MSKKTVSILSLQRELAELRANVGAVAKSLMEESVYLSAYERELVAAYAKKLQKLTEEP